MVSKSIFEEGDFNAPVIVARARKEHPIPINQNISKEVQKDLEIYMKFPDEITSIKMKMQKGELEGVFYNKKNKMYEYKGKTPEEKEKNQMLALKDMDRIAETAVAIRQKYLPEISEFQLAAQEKILPDLKGVVKKTSQDFDREREERKNLRSYLKREMSEEIISDLFNSKPPFETNEIKEISEIIGKGEIDGIEKKFDESIGREVFAYKGKDKQEKDKNRGVALTRMAQMVVMSEDETKMRAKYGLK